VKTTLHWVSAEHAIEAEVRLYDHLFAVPEPDDVPEGVDFRSNLNPHSLEVLLRCYLEPSLQTAEPGSRYQFERLGYFRVDPKQQQNGGKTFIRTISLRDSWAKEAQKS